MLLILTGCAKKQEAAEEKEAHHEEESNAGNVVELTAAQYQTYDIQFGKPVLRSLSDVVTANGVIDIPPSNLFSVSAPMGGFVRNTELLQGMKVRKGQILAVIENPDFIQIQQDYLETESELAYAETEYKRQQELSTENVAAQKVFQQATSRLRTLKARLAGLRERLRTAGINMKELEKGVIVNHANIISPLTGSVTAVNVNLGKFVNPTDVMFEIVDTDHLHVELSVFEKDISRLKLGQLVRFTVNNNLGKEELARVYLINPKINEDRTVRVHCHLVKNDPTLLPQNYVKAVIETGTRKVPSLPVSAVTEFAGKSYVFVNQGKEGYGNALRYVFKMTEIQKGASEGGFVHVIFPDNATGELDIVTKGAYALLSKMKNSESEEHAH